MSKKKTAKTEDVPAVNDPVTEQVTAPAPEIMEEKAPEPEGITHTMSSEDLGATAYGGDVVVQVDANTKLIYREQDPVNNVSEEATWEKIRILLDLVKENLKIISEKEPSLVVDHSKKLLDDLVVFISEK